MSIGCSFFLESGSNSASSSRQLTTGNDIVIKTPKRRRTSTSTSRSRSQHVTPKWVPVSQDSGALITEELSMAYSPVMHMESQTTTTTTKTTPKIRSPKKKKSTTSKHRVTKKPPQTPRTPQDKINEEYEPRVAADTSRKVKSTKSKSKKSKTSKAKAKEPEPMEEEEDDDDDEEYQDRAQGDIGGESDNEVDDLYQHGTTEVKISRLPTSSARLTSIDIVLQQLNDSLSIEHGKHFQTFQKLNKNYLDQVLDLNLTNNYYLYKLRDLKSEKTHLRSELFDKKQEINENLMNLEKLRNKYNKVREILLKRRKINENLEKIKTPSSSNQSILSKLNKLNNIVDPNWGILDKIRELNSKFVELDETN